MGEGITGGKRIGGELRKIYSSIKRIIKKNKEDMSLAGDALR